MPYQTRFTSEKYAKKLLAKHNYAWKKATEKYDVAVFVTITLIDTKSKEDTLLDILEELEESREIIVEGDRLIVRRTVLDGTNIVNTFFALALLSSIIEFWMENIGEPELNSILETFGKLYENLGLEVNSKFLERDIREIEERSKDLVGESLLLDLYAFGDDQKPKKSSDPKRNFFAHSGLLREITWVRKVGDKVLLRYDLKLARKNVLSWLRDPGKS